MFSSGHSDGPADHRPGFLEGFVDGVFARRFWDPEVASAEKSVDYVIGELWAVSTQPLAALAALLDWERLRETGSSG